MVVLGLILIIFPRTQLGMWAAAREGVRDRRRSAPMDGAGAARQPTRNNNVRSSSRLRYVSI
eukprot:1593271-Heterocapsa_arctica.AAC.1